MRMHLHKRIPAYHGPEDFYRRLGFHPTGEHNEGETVAERILLASSDK